MTNNHFGSLARFGFDKGIYFPSDLTMLCSFALPYSPAQITSSTFAVCSLSALEIPEQTLLIYENLWMVKTRRSITELFDEYGENNQITDWPLLHDLLRAFVGKRNNCPYLSTREAFMNIDKQLFLNINLIQSYHRIPHPEDEAYCKTKIHGPAGCVINLPLDYYQFQKKYRKDASWFLSYRGTKAGYYEPNPALVNILTQPTMLNPLLLREEKAGKYKHKIISIREWTDKKNELLAKRWEKNLN